MAASILFVLVVYAVITTSGLQVAPNSGCSSVCMDDLSQDVSDLNVSNTNGSSIVCNDADYDNTVVGERFKNCINCLQNSTASDSDSGETDATWFLYNIRYAIDTCIYGYANVTEPISTPCSTNAVCAPLQAALEDNMLDPSGGTQYSYCSASNNSFLSGALELCSSCFRQTDNEVYFSNFLVALQAGCVQQPKNGTPIGLDGTLFSQVPVNITSSGVLNSSSRSHKPLSVGAIIGIAAGGVVFLVAIAAIVFICSRKHRNRKWNSQIRSQFNERHGSGSISAPTKGAFVEPPTSPPAVYEEFTLQKLWNNPSKDRPIATTTLGRNNFRAVEPHYARQHVRRAETGSTQQFSTQALPPAYVPSGAQEYSISPKDTPPLSSSSISASPSTFSVNRSSNTTTSTSTTFKSKISPILASGLPKAFSPRPNSGSFSKPVRLTRDLSVSREGNRRTNNPSTVSPNSISGPMIIVSSRFEDEEDAARERLGQTAYNNGLGEWGGAHQLAERTSEESIERWPGTY